MKQRIEEINHQDPFKGRNPHAEILSEKPQNLSPVQSPISANDLRINKKEIRKEFFKYACSGAMFLSISRHYDDPAEDIASASSALSGGIMQKGNQCGMLWGASLAAGAESFRRNKDQNQAVSGAIAATQHIMRSFKKRAKHIDCRDISGGEWTNTIAVIKYLITGKIFRCLRIGKNWAREAIHSIEEGLTATTSGSANLQISCATEVAKRMGASDKEMVMVAGFAGGMGLSGNACGALAAVILIKSLKWFREKLEMKEMYNPYAKQSLNAFYSETNSRILCRDICGKQFSTADQHSEFIRNGGCLNLINMLATS